MDTKEREALERELGIMPEEEKADEGWSIETYKDANWAIGVFAKANQRINERNAFVLDRIERLKKRLDELNKDDEKTLNTMGKYLQKWGEDQVKDQKGKTVKLILGDLQYRDVSEKIVINDPDTVANNLIEVGYEVEMTIKVSTAVPKDVEDAVSKHGKIKKIEKKPAQKTVDKYYDEQKVLPGGAYWRPKLYNASFKINLNKEMLEGETQGQISEG